MHLSKDLFTSCRGVRSFYVAFLEAQKLEPEMEKKWKIDEEAEWEKAKEEDKKSDVLKRLEGDLELLHAGIRVADNAVEEGTTDFSKMMAKKPLDLNNLKTSQAQIAMGGKRKNELQLEVGQVEKKIKKAKEELNEQVHQKRCK